MRRSEGGGARHKRQVIGFGGGERLIPTKVDVWPWGQLDHLTNDVVEKLVGALAVDAERAEADLDSLVRRRRDPVAVEFWVGAEGGVGVTRHVDLWHDRDVFRGGIGDNFAVVGFGIEATPATVHLRARTDLGQRRPRVDLQPPALIVGEVQVKVVEFEHRDVVDVPFDVWHRKEVAGDVEHGSAVLETRKVVDARHVRHAIDR